LTQRASVAVVGGGWAGLAAAVEATRLGHPVTLFEMAAQAGGRARRVDIDGLALDNGQHIMIGAYRETLRMIALVGVDAAQAFVRTPLNLAMADGNGLRLPPGAPVLAFLRAVLGHPRWRWHDKLCLLTATLRWSLGGFRAPPRRSVAELARGVPASIRAELIEPLCVAALNTEASQASAAVFLRVLRDALFSGPGSADLLMPARDLGALFPAPALAWLAARGATLHLGRRVQAVEADGAAWRVDGERFERVVLAATPAESARLAAAVAPHWAATAQAMPYEPIVTLYLRSAGTRLPEAMLALRSDAQHPAQFVFDRGRLGGPEGLLAFVISGAQAWVDRGAQATLQATLTQAAEQLGPHLRAPLTLQRQITERRATFRCEPGLARPGMRVAPGLHAAGDHVDGPYPATLEGAVRSGIDAVRAFGS
jgi:hydroxysqualene dehydroxylase